MRFLNSLSLKFVAVKPRHCNYWVDHMNGFNLKDVPQNPKRPSNIMFYIKQHNLILEHVNAVLSYDYSISVFFVGYVTKSFEMSISQATFFQ